MRMGACQERFGLEHPAAKGLGFGALRKPMKNGETDANIKFHI